METTVAAGMTLTDGNSDTLQAHASVVTEGERSGLGALRFGVEANYGESTIDDESETTLENVKGFANVNKTLSERTLAYIAAFGLTDDIAEVDYRATVGPGLGVYLANNETLKISVEGGVSYVWEEVADEKSDYTALRMAERVVWVMSETAKIWHALEYLPKAEDFDDYLLSAEFGVEAALNSTLNLRVVVQDTYDSEPAPGLEENDLLIIAGISFKI